MRELVDLPHRFRGHLPADLELLEDLLDRRALALLALLERPLDRLDLLLQLLRVLLTAVRRALAHGTRLLDARL